MRTTAKPFRHGRRLAVAATATATAVLVLLATAASLSMLPTAEGGASLAPLSPRAAAALGTLGASMAPRGRSRRSVFSCRDGRVVGADVRRPPTAVSMVDPMHSLLIAAQDAVDVAANVATAASDAVGDVAAASSEASEAAASLAVVASDAANAAASEASAAASTTTPSYSKWSYYTTLGLYVMSFPGIWSQIKRSTEAKVKRKTYVSDGINATPPGSGKDMRQQAGEIMAYMKANNYDVEQAGEVITFRGIVQRSTSQAFFLTFCTALGMASLALVLQIQFQNFLLPIFEVKPNWFYLVLLSPYAGIYYWSSGDRVDDIKVKLATNDDETENEIVVEGNDDELDRMWRALNWREKGMVKVEGLLQS